MDELKIMNFWDRKLPAPLQEKVVNFWLGLGVPQAQIQERVGQIAFVVNQGGIVAAVLTVFETHSQRLKHNFFAYRILVGESFRKKNLAGKVLNLANSFFEQKFLMGETKNIGAIINSENAAFNSYRNEAIWPATGFIFIGHSPEGGHIRVKYFREARV